MKAPAVWPIYVLGKHQINTRFFPYISFIVFSRLFFHTHAMNMYSLPCYFSSLEPIFVKYETWEYSISTKPITNSNAGCEKTYKQVNLIKSTDLITLTCVSHTKTPNWVYFRGLFLNNSVKSWKCLIRHEFDNCIRMHDLLITECFFNDQFYLYLLYNGSKK